MPHKAVTRARVRAVVILVWLVMVAWLLRFEVFPDLFAGTTAGYRTLLSRDVLVTDAWMRIKFNDVPIGFSHSSMELDERHPSARHVVKNRVNVRMSVMGSEQKIYVDTIVRLDDGYDLQAFEFNLSSQGYKMHLRARRQEENMFRVDMDTGVSKQTTTLEVPPDVVLYSPMTEMAMKRLKPGQSLSLKTLDPTSMSTTTLTIKALRTEPLTIGEKTYDSTVLSTDYHGASVLSWIDSDGNMLRQETPFGWTMEVCTMKEAFAALAGDKGDMDFLAGMAVPCSAPIPQPHRQTRLRLRLKGVAFEEGELGSARQTVLRREGKTLELEVLSADSVPPPQGPVPLDPSPYLEPTLSLQCDHEEIRAKSARITADAQTAADKARAIAEWVHDNVDKEMTVSLPSALDVLRSLKGDCNEHTYLTVALARAAGVPAKIVVGLAYHEGAFYYHAWPALYVDGRWFETDPTWGQDGVDATHIAVLEGDLAKQLELIRIMGQLRIEVMD